MATPATAVVSMKLLIDTKSRRVLFAEAGKDAIDFLFSLLALPLATVAALVGTGSMAGSVGNLRASVQNLDDSYVVPGADKGALLHPVLVASPATTDRNCLLLPPSLCGGPSRGFVQGVVTYTVRDDLTITPMSAISSVTLLNSFAVRDLADLQEKTVWLGFFEGLAILRASLQSKTVLTDVFLGR